LRKCIETFSDVSNYPGAVMAQWLAHLTHKSCGCL